MFGSKIFKVTSDIQKLHFKFCGHVVFVDNSVGAHPKSSSLAVLAELGRLLMSIQISTLFQVIKYWLRINIKYVVEAIKHDLCERCNNMWENLIQQNQVQNWNVICIRWKRHRQAVARFRIYIINFSSWIVLFRSSSKALFAVVLEIMTFATNDLVNIFPHLFRIVLNI